jgi:hypothetical protein
MKTCQRDLSAIELDQLRNNWEQTLSNAVLHALGCVATNIGLLDIVSDESSSGREWKWLILRDICSKKCSIVFLPVNDLISQFSEYIGITQPAVGYAKRCLISWEGQWLKFR